MTDQQVQALIPPTSMGAHQNVSDIRKNTTQGMTNGPNQINDINANGNGTGVNNSQYAEDLMAQFNLGEALNDLRSRKLRSSFTHYIAEIPTNVVPLKPRCPAGLLAEIARQPVNEDERRLELFDERVLRSALTLKESTEKVKMPTWLEIEQPWGEEDRKKRRRDKKKKKKKKKRKRISEDPTPGEGDQGKYDEEEKRLRKKRKST